MSAEYVTLTDEVEGLLREAFHASHPAADPVVTVSGRTDYQANGAFALAKATGTAPRAIADEVAARVGATSAVVAEASGAGFINLTVTTETLARHLRAFVADERLGVPTAATALRVVIDYSSPNVAKEMHVGHLRTTVIGDCLRRLYEWAGHTVIARNHIGDWGTPFGKLIEHLVDLGADADVATFSLGDLGEFYVAASRKFDESEAFRERSRERVVLLQAGDPATRRLWRILVDQLVAYLDGVYAKLDVKLRPEDVVGESAYNDDIERVVADLAAAGVLVENEGAQCVFPPGFTNRDGDPLPLIVRKSDGGYGYAATDLAALRDRVDRLGADEIFYVVGSTQALHLSMVFATARLAGWLPERVRCEHVGFGNVLGTDRKLLRSRQGGTAKLMDLVDETIERADASLRERDVEREMDGDERRRIAVQIARAAIKYADLSTERQHDYVFDVDRMTAFEGDTGPYLCYAVARIRSIFRRLEEPWAPGDVEFSLDNPTERALAIAVLRLPDAITVATSQLSPHRLCTQLFEIAQRFTSFYEACPVLGATGATRDERLALCDLTRRALELGLGLLGITAPERM